MAAAIEIDRVSKTFRLYREKYTSLKERLIHLGRVPYESFRGTRCKPAQPDALGLCAAPERWELV